jgi:hypothetical protein
VSDLILGWCSSDSGAATEGRPYMRSFDCIVEGDNPPSGFSLSTHNQNGNCSATKQ